VARSRDDDAGEGAGPGRVPLEGADELRRTPVEVVIPAADDGRDGQADPSEGGPASIGPVVGEDVFRLARPIQAEVTPGAPEAPGARDECLRISARDPLRARDPASKLAAADALHLSRDVGDGPEQHQPNQPAVAGAGRVVENLVGAGGVPGEDDAAVA